jgi:hypothetical protein
MMSMITPNTICRTALLKPDPHNPRRRFSIRAGARFWKKVAVYGLCQAQGSAAAQDRVRCGAKEALR